MLHLKWFRGASLVILAGLSTPKSWAYSLGDHERITRSAIAALNACMEQPLSLQTTEQLISANLWEDKNLIRKWTAYSHFYHPHDHFESGRLNSSDRIENLSQRISPVDGESATAELLGKAIHHLQDMTVPVHVLPVNHIWTDGFESLDVQLTIRTNFESCAALFDEATTTPLRELHQATAESTLRWVQTSRLEAIRVSAETPPRNSLLPLSAFWVSGRGSSSGWGSYGVLGNSFGADQFDFGGFQYQVRPGAFIRLKLDRLSAASRATQLAVARILILGLDP